ncbi:hypothetical protein Tco_0424210 [Tanacetum coccineum]
MEVSRLSVMDNDLFTYEVKVAKIPCNSKMDDDSEDEADDDMGHYGFTGSDEMMRLSSQMKNLLMMEIKLLKPMKITKTTGSTNGIKMYHGCTTSHSLIMEYGKSQHQSNIRASLSIIRLGIRNDQPVVGEMMDTIMEETYPKLTLLETNSIIRIMNGMKLWKIDLVKEKSTNIGGEFTKSGDPEVLEF